MPMQSHTGWQGIPWHICDRCGFQYPVSQLTRQAGIIVCQKCADNPLATISNDRRQEIMAQRISEPGEEPRLADILKTTDDMDSNL